MNARLCIWFCSYNSACPNSFVEGRDAAITMNSVKTETTCCNEFWARDSMCGARYRLSPVVCLSDCPSHGWISQKRL